MAPIIDMTSRALRGRTHHPVDFQIHPISGGTRHLLSLCSKGQGGAADTIHLFAHTRGAAVRIVVLPESKYRPTCRLKHRIGVSITRDVGDDLGVPVPDVGLRLHVVSGASMPETTVNEHRDAFTPENQVGRPTKPPQWALAHSVPQPKSVNLGAQE
jgi:hypothetical protein